MNEVIAEPLYSVGALMHPVEDVSNLSMVDAEEMITILRQDRIVNRNVWVNNF